MPHALTLYLILALVVGYLGRRTRLGALRSFMLSILLTPLIVFIYLLLFAAIDGEARPKVLQRKDS
jgi:hypothetical protein